MNIRYDEEAKILSIRFGNAKSVDSDIQKNLVVDYAADGSIVGIDIMRFSIDDFHKVPKVFLEPSPV